MHNYTTTEWRKIKTTGLIKSCVKQIFLDEKNEKNKTRWHIKPQKSIRQTTVRWMEWKENIINYNQLINVRNFQFLYLSHFITKQTYKEWFGQNIKFQEGFIRGYDHFLLFNHWPESKARKLEWKIIQKPWKFLPIKPEFELF